MSAVAIDIASAAMVEHVLDYIARVPGARVFPIKAGAKSQPLIKDWPNQASNDPEQIKWWWAKWPDANYGVTNVVTIDVDVKDGKPGRESFRKLEIPDAEKKAALLVHTPSGGFHFTYLKPEGVSVPSPVGFREGIDIRADGAYVVGPGSVLVDSEGNEIGRYRLDTARDETPPVCSAALKQLIGERRPKERSKTGEVAAGVTINSDTNVAVAQAFLKDHAPAIEGQHGDDWTVATANLAMDLGISPDLCLELMLDWNDRCLPPWELERLQEKIDSAYRSRERPLGVRSPEFEFAGINIDEPPPREQAVSLADFRAYMPSHQYVYMPTGEMWPQSSVNARFAPIGGVKASTWLDQNRAVEQMTWLPGADRVVANRLVSDGGWIPKPGCNVFNLYRPPLELIGDPLLAGPWIDHVHKVYPDEADHIIKWLAHRVQRPQEKINHALVLGGSQGIGKDTLLEPVKLAVGPWNFTDVSPQNMLGRFNGFLRSVILRVSEARDLGDVDRFKFYDHMKGYTAAPPDVLRVDQKFRDECAIFNVCGVIITSNHKTDGIYLPPDDRRHFVAWSDATKEDFDEGYWKEIYGWFDNGGAGHVAACLRELDLSSFDPKAPPPKTEAFWAIVSANGTPEDAELADVLDKMGRPDAVTIPQILEAAGFVPLSDWLKDRRNSRRIPYRLEECGYVSVRNSATRDGYWKIGGTRCSIYSLAALSIRDRTAAARRVAGW